MVGSPLPEHEVIENWLRDPSTAVGDRSTVGVHGNAVPSAIDNAVDGAATLTTKSVDVIVHAPRAD